MYDPRKLRRALDVQGRKVDWLADQMGYDRVHVSKVLNGIVPMVDKFAVLAAKALGIPIEWLLLEETAVAHAA